MNLKTKSSLAVVILLIALFGTGLLVQDYLIQNSIKRSVADQQSVLVSSIAQEIEQRLRINVEALRGISRGIDAGMMQDTARLRGYLDAQQGMLSMFSAVIVMAPELIVMADLPQMPGRVGTDVSNLAHLQQIRVSAEPVISAPFFGRVVDRPLVAQSVAALGADGEIVAIVSGTMDLLAESFLGTLSARKYGRGGRFVLTTHDRLSIIGGTDHSALEAYLPPGVSPVYDQALSGWQGTELSFMGNGQPTLMSFRTLEHTGWILGAIMPAEEAFAAVAESRQTAIALLFGSSILAGLLVWLAARLALRRLLALRDDMASAGEGAAGAPLAAYGNDEIGELASSFFKVFEDLAQSRSDSLKQAEELQSILDACPVGIAITQQGRIKRLNPAFQRIFGVSSDALDGETLARFHDSPDDYEETKRWVRAGIGNGRTLTLERQFVKQCGARFWSRVYVRQLDPDDIDKGIVILIEDTSERRANEERIRFMAEHDSLTGLPNRLLLNDRLVMAMASARRKGGQLALMFIDLDRFKNINDSLGHHVGDQLLVQIAQRIKSVLRETDTVGRPGGDEFALLLPEVADARAAAGVAEKLLTCLAEAYDVAGHHLSVTVSIGIALYPDDGRDIETLAANADAAMYHSKDLGRNTYQFFRAEMNERVLERMQLEHAMRAALHSGEFELHYQPQVEGQSRKVIGFEALVRWNHPRQGLISPARFIPVAEDTGLIVPLGDWVLSEACRQNKAWLDSGLPPLPVSVNISPVQFRQPDFAASVARRLETTGLPAGCLELELTEGVMMNAVERNIETLRSLRDLGVKVSIDDFGTGYSSLAYLKRLPIDKLKIDQAFVRDVADDPDDAAIITTIIGLARNMKLRVVAEGVENEEQMRFLIAGGCTQHQGYLFSRPLPAIDFEHFWRDSLDRNEP